MEHFNNRNIDVKKMNSFFVIWGYKLKRSTTRINDVTVHYYALRTLN
jgi:hypothetical protein